MKRILFLLLLATATTLLWARSTKDLQSACLQQGIEAIKNQDLASAKQFLDAELLKNPKNGYAHAWYAVLCSFFADSEEIVPMLKNADKYIPKSDKRYLAWINSYWLSNIYYMKEDIHGAVYHMTEAIKIEPKNELLRNARGSFYLELEEYELAKQDFTPAIQINDNDTTSYTMLGIAHHKLEEHQLAIQYLSQANDFMPTSVNYIFIAMSELHLKEYIDAANHIIQALQLDPLDPTAITLLQDYYSDINHLNAFLCIQKQFELAIDMDLAIAAVDDKNDYNMLISNAYWYLGDWENALAYAKNAYAINPDRPNAYETLHRYADLHLFDEALIILNDIATNDTHNLLHSTRGDIYCRMKDYPRAIEEYTTYIQYHPNDKEGYLLRAYAHLLNNDTIQAKKDFQHIYDRPTDIYLSSLTKLLAGLHLGEQEGAEEILQEYLNPDFVWHTRHLVLRCYALLGQTEKAFTLLEELLQDNYILFEKLRQDPDLVSLHGERFDSLLNTYETQMHNRIQAYRNKSCPNNTK